MKLPKTLYLDLKTWRCGGLSQTPHNRNGKGPTGLLNKQGYSCCLGQWIQQTDKTIDIHDLSDPYEIPDCKIWTLTKREQDDRVNTNFSNRCVSINDEIKTSVVKKISLLRKLLKKYRRKLVLRNVPDELRSRIKASHNR